MPEHKRAFGNESREDHFQMCGYAVAFDADVVSLVYPVATNEPKGRILLKTKGWSKRKLRLTLLNSPWRRAGSLQVGTDEG